MSPLSWPQRLVFAVGVSTAAAVVALVVGPMYLRPLPIWLKLVIAGAGCCVIAAIAVYSRRRAR